MSPTHLLRLILFSLLAAIVYACSDGPNLPALTPAAENVCNVSCGFDHEKNKSCFENPIVLNYFFNQVAQGLAPEVGPILNRSSPSACFCGIVVLDRSGTIKSVTITKSTDVNMAKAIRAVLLDSNPAPIPPGAECVVDIELPLSFDN